PLDRAVQHAERPGDTYTALHGCIPAVPFVDQEQVSTNLLDQRDSVAFTILQERQGRIAGSSDRPHLKPRRRVGDPGPDGLRRTRMPELVEDGLGDEDAVEELRENVDRADEDKVVERRGIGAAIIRRRVSAGSRGPAPDPQGYSEAKHRAPSGTRPPGVGAQSRGAASLARVSGPPSDILPATPSPTPPAAG